MILQLMLQGQGFQQSKRNMILFTKPIGNFLHTGSGLGFEAAAFLSMGCVESLRHKCLLLRAFSWLVKEEKKSAPVYSAVG